ncbi:MAG: hypothetical protein ACI9LM_002089 [Alteromonadaceae bacterium]|jgi:hypothetical protein
MLTKIALNIFIIVSATTLLSCSKGGSKTITITPSPVTAPVSDIPKTEAVIFSPAPSLLVPQLNIPTVNHAVLRHVYRDSVKGERSPFADFLDSSNAVVERHIALGFYSEIAIEPDNSYIIEPEDNGLAYFRVTNTRPSGRVRVHNFYGVPAGYYMTFDSTDIDYDNSTKSNCRDVAVRINDLSTQTDSAARLMFNGQLISDAVYKNNQAYQEHFNLCAISSKNDYLLVIAYENEPRNIRYGFHYYKDLADADLLEITLEHQAEIIEWSSDHKMDDDFIINGKKSSWRRHFGLYRSHLQGGMNGYLPKFPLLAVDSYTYVGRYEESSGGINIVKREFLSDAVDVIFDVNQMQLNDISLTPYEINWQSMGQDSEKIISGIIFDKSLTQTYAFMSMDPDVLLEKKLNFPLDNFELLLESTVGSLVAVSSGEEAQLRFVTDAALLSGFSYWPSKTGDVAHKKLNSDIFISGDGSELLALLIKELGD